MTDLPAPLTPPDCDLRGYDFMPILGHRLFQSSLYRIAVVTNPRAGLAAIKLWWEAWNQVPCGSLPDNEIELSVMADFGADVKGWRKCSDLSMRGFVKCSDGRWYHPVLCAEAIEKFRFREKHEAKRGKDRERLAQWRDRQHGNGATKRASGHAETSDETHDETRFTTDENEKTGVSSQGKREREKETLLPSVVERGAQTAPAPPRKPTKRGSRIPDDWALSGDLRAFALGKGFDFVRVEHIAEKFKNHWQASSGSNATKIDWDAAFRVWVNNEFDRFPPGPTVRPAQNRGEQPLDRMTPQEKRLAVWANVPDVEGV
ncbi:hypothetical protein AA103196_3115 [Ameyamaea chiangmaiensis NBRC 103196]|uniref:DUF1376 domain-containing protein n=1 Tax=Ameyamaea chiangmaiensis TaxID=442969 RepID=A0A850P3X6_9PROT|nr:hypothetical protein [Ameyamaea chiangmaiensis]MBS4074601.1 hypothetical protein [Ameyamaea chiangmaiensis]NVN39357.1 hypothetical protein [Ameyamaea chiangmaiensis]GBQ72628.1 hypothetical protein AA103196_3115 [Ameyamaea chiangmaiensis NBRC 103196]